MGQEHWYYTTEEVATMFRVSVRTVRRWIKDGSLEAVDIGRQYRIYHKAVTEFAARRGRAPGAA